MRAILPTYDRALVAGAWRLELRPRLRDSAAIHEPRRFDPRAVANWLRKM
jgi:hypothetical protein